MLVMPVVGEVGVVIVPAPLINVQILEPTAATVPANVAVVPHTVWFAPAAATVGGCVMFTVVVAVALPPALSITVRVYVVVFVSVAVGLAAEVEFNPVAGLHE